jgi:hypothetical protein
MNGRSFTSCTCRHCMPDPPLLGLVLAEAEHARSSPTVGGRLAEPVKVLVVGEDETSSNAVASVVRDALARSNRYASVVVQVDGIRHASNVPLDFSESIEADRLALEGMIDDIAGMSRRLRASERIASRHPRPSDREERRATAREAARTSSSVLARMHRERPRPVRRIVPE